jgi:hypothetical protein
MTGHQLRLLSRGAGVQSTTCPRPRVQDFREVSARNPWGFALLGSDPAAGFGGSGLRTGSRGLGCDDDCSVARPVPEKAFRRVLAQECSELDLELCALVAEEVGCRPGHRVGAVDDAVDVADDVGSPWGVHGARTAVTAPAGASLPGAVNGSVAFTGATPQRIRLSSPYSPGADTLTADAHPAAAAGHPHPGEGRRWS